MVVGLDKDNKEVLCDKPAACKFNACAEHCLEMRADMPHSSCSIHQKAGVTTTNTFQPITTIITIK